MNQSTLKMISDRTLQRDVNAAWEFANKELFENHSFNEEETAMSKELIRELFADHSKEYYMELSGEKFFEFCARIILARNHVKRKSGRYIPHPVIWFNPKNKFGFIATGQWLKENILRDQYKKIRFYNNNGTLEKKSA